LVSASHSYTNLSAADLFKAQARDAAALSARESTAHKPRVLIAGGAGALGSAVLERFCGTGAWGTVSVLVQDRLQSTLPFVETIHIDSVDTPDKSPIGIIIFDQARNYADRERAFWMPAPEQLFEAAKKLQAHGVESLAVVVPHLQASLPQALKLGLANIDEQQVSELHFKRLLFVRPAAVRTDEKHADFLPWLAHWMLKQLSYIVPDNQRPVRAVKLASFVEAALSAWVKSGSMGTRVVSPELLWQAAAAADMQAFALKWEQAQSLSVH
jgi:hypothetical protein